MSNELEIGASIKNMIALLPELAASSMVMAKAFKLMYDAYVEVGFTEDQALEIVKARGILP